MTPDERLAAYILTEFKKTGYDLKYMRNNHGDAPTNAYEHLKSCSGTRMKRLDEDEYGDGSCGEGTCEMWFVDATMTCQHDFTWDYRYSDFGDWESFYAGMAEVES